MESTPVIRYIELKTGYNDNGPAWIAKVKVSKSGRTIYFNNHAFRLKKGIFSNYCDVETGEEYWISGVKRDGTDRHWAGGGTIQLDSSIQAEYLAITGEEAVDTTRLTVVDIPENYPVERIRALENHADSSG